MQRLALLVLILLMSPMVFAEPLPNWARLSLRLSGENWKVHKEVIDELRSIKDLKVELDGALENPDLRPLAIDVLVAMRMQSLNDRLLKIAPRDPDGLVVLALNSLLTDDQRRKARDLYIDLLASGGIAIPTQIAILDSLGRSNDVIPPATLSSCLLSDDPDVRRAALTYVRELWLHRPPGPKHKSWWELISPTLSSGTYQTRLQAYFLLTEFHKHFSEEVPQALLACKSDKNLEVRRYCHSQEKKSL